MLFVGLAAKKPPLQVVAEEVAPTVHPANARLVVLLARELQLPPPAHPATTLIAAAMFWAASPLDDPVSGTPLPPVVPKAFPIASFRPSKLPKKKSLSFLIGPPMEPPYCFNCAGGLSQAASGPTKQVPPC